VYHVVTSFSRICFFCRVCLAPLLGQSEVTSDLPTIRFGARDPIILIPRVSLLVRRLSHFWVFFGLRSSLLPVVLTRGTCLILDVRALFCCSLREWQPPSVIPSEAYPPFLSCDKFERAALGPGDATRHWVYTTRYQPSLPAFVSSLAFSFSPPQECVPHLLCAARCWPSRVDRPLSGRPANFARPWRRSFDGSPAAINRWPLRYVRSLHPHLMVLSDSMLFLLRFTWALSSGVYSIHTLSRPSFGLHEITSSTSPFIDSASPLCTPMFAGTKRISYEAR